MNQGGMSFIRGVQDFLWKHHLVLFVVVAFGGIALAMYSLVSVVNLSTTSNSSGTDGAIVFDKDTISRVNALGIDGTQSFTLPTGVRTDPFAE